MKLHDFKARRLTCLYFADRPAWRLPGYGEMPNNPQISIVIPLFDEEENIQRLVQSVRTAMRNAGPWELILVDDGSRDATFERAGREGYRRAFDVVVGRQSHSDRRVEDAESDQPG